MVRSTWAWLEGKSRRPTEYEELSVGLQWKNTGLVTTKTGTWSQESTKLFGVDWDDFRDPSQLYYRTYVAMQNRAERELDGVLQVVREGGLVDELDPEWRKRLCGLIGPMAFAEWGVAMVMQYVQRFCLSSTLALSAQLQTCDELRHAQRELELFDLLDSAADPRENDPARDAWLGDPALQPLRRFIEELLVLDDWGQAIVAANLVLGPLLQAFLREVLIVGGRHHRDSAAIALGRHIWTDESRHLAWAEAFVRLAVAAEEANVATVQGWIDQHITAALAAVEQLAAGLGDEELAAHALTVARDELAQTLRGLAMQTIAHAAL